MNNIFDIGRIVIVICPQCNLHCRDCALLDFHGSKKIGKMLEIDDIRNILEVFKKEGLCPSTLTLQGGEPLLHPHFEEIVDLCLSYGFPCLEIITNATLLTPKILSILKKATNVEFSIYPFSKKIYRALKSSKMLLELKKSVCVNFRLVDDFHVYNKDAVEIRDVQKNFDSCTMKDQCRVVTPKGLYRCWILYMLDQDCYPLERNAMIECLARKAPFKKCGSCDHWIGPTVRCKSASPGIDKKVVNKAVDIIKAGSGDARQGVAMALHNLFTRKK